MIVGHTHRISNLMRGNILITEGINAGTSYSVLQLMVEHGDVTWAGGATRVAKNLGVQPDPAVQAIVDDANAATAELRNQVVGTQPNDILRDLPRRHESEMGNMVTDAMREKYPGVDAAYTNSGGLRQDIVFTPPAAGEQPGQITWGEVFAVLPFGNRTTLLTLTGAQLQEALLNGFSTVLQSDLRRRHRPLPADLSGLQVTFHCNGLTPVVDSITKARRRARRRRSARPTACGSSRTTSCTPAATGTPSSPRAPTCSSRATTSYRSPIEYITAHSPVDPVVEGRIVGPPGP